MPSGRGLVVFGRRPRDVGGRPASWAPPGSRSSGIGLVVLPFARRAVRALGPHRICVIRRRLSDVRVAPGTRVTVRLDVENRAPAPTPFLLLEDRLPAAAGAPGSARRDGPARHDEPAASRTRSCRRPAGATGSARSRSTSSDPFALTRQRLEFDERDDLLVTPEIEDLFAAPDSGRRAELGATRARQLFRTRRGVLHDARVPGGRRPAPDPLAVRGAHRRADDPPGRVLAAGERPGVRRQPEGTALGQSHSPAFERAVSVAATLGVLLAQRRVLAAARRRPKRRRRPVSEERFLDALAGIAHADRRARSAASLAHLRAGASADTTLVFVAAPPAPRSSPSLIRAGAGFGPKLAVLVHPVDPDTLPPARARAARGPRDPGEPRPSPAPGGTASSSPPRRR